VGPVHGGGDAQRQTRQVYDAADGRSRHHLSPERQVADAPAAIGGDVRWRWESDRSVDALHGILRARDGADHLLPAPSRLRRGRYVRRCTDGIRGCWDVRDSDVAPFAAFARGRREGPGATRSGRRCSSCLRARHLQAQPPKRGFWGRIFRR
jgi:hypothetical protein